MNRSPILLRLFLLVMAVTIAGHTILAQADITGYWRPSPATRTGAG